MLYITIQGLWRDYTRSIIAQERIETCFWHGGSIIFTTYFRLYLPHISWFHTFLYVWGCDTVIFSHIIALLTLVIVFAN